jgi:hypothetical protein
MTYEFYAKYTTTQEYMGVYADNPSRSILLKFH